MAKEKPKIPDVADEKQAGLSVPTKLTLAFTVLIMVAALDALLIWVWTTPTGTTLERTDMVRVPTETASANARADLLEMTSNILGYLSLGEPHYLEQYKNAHDEFLREIDHLDTLLAMIDDPEANKLLRDIKATYADWSELPNQMFDMHGKPLENRPALYTLSQSGEPLIDQVLEEITAMTEEQAQRRVSAENMKLLKHMADFRGSFVELASGVRGYVGSLEPRFKEIYREALTLNKQHWKELEAARDAMSETQQEDFRLLAEARSGFLSLPEAWIFPAAEGDESRKDLYMLRNSAVPLAKKMDELLRYLVEEQVGLLKVDVQQGRTNLRQLQWQTSLVTVLTLVIGSALAYGFRRTIIRDIDRRRRAETAVRSAQQNLLEIEQEAFDRVQEELETTREELVKSTRMATLGQLTATVSHEIRNPLGTIRTSVFSVAEKIRGSSPLVDRALDRAERNIVRCDQIIEELLDYTRTKESQPVSTDIDRWLGDLLQDQDLPEQVSVERNLSSEVTLEIDREQLRRCVVNLVTNACHAMTDPPTDDARLTVSTFTQEDRLLIRVSDTGCGIAQDVVAKIFEPLFTTKGFGVGLGLPIVDQLISQLGGGVSILSDPGQGTTATLWLPLHTEPLQTEEEP